MKILILTNFDVGLYKFRKELLAELLKTHEVYISLPKGDLVGPLKEMGCKFLDTTMERRGMNPLKDIKLFLTYLKWILTVKPDVVLTYTIKPNIYGGLACTILKKPYFANITGLGTSIENPGILQKVALFLYKLGLHKCNCVFFQNRANLEYFRDKGVLPGNRSARLIPGSGVNLTEHCLEEYPDEEELHFLFIGRIMKDKGVEELFDAAKRVKQKYTSRKIRFRFIGDCDEDYRTQLNELEQDGILEWLGFQKNVHQYIAGSHCTVLPSYHEGTANVLLESAASGRPVIATLVNGCKETFDDGVSGYGCEPRSGDSLFHQLCRFVEGTAEEHRNMGLAGRKKMEKEYDRNIVVQAYLEEIHDVIREG